MDIDTASFVTPNTPTNPRKLWFLIFTVGILLSGFIGYLVGSSIQPIIQQAPAPKPHPVKFSPLFKTQIASLEGIITEVSGLNITVKGENNQMDIFPLGPNVNIYKIGKQGLYQATASADLKDIELNKAALISLQAINGEYKVITIAYIDKTTIPTPPPLQPTPAPKNR